MEELLAPEPAERLGMGARGYAEMRRHAWFDGFDWSALRDGTMAAPREPGSQNQVSPDKPETKIAPATKCAASKAMLNALGHLQQQSGQPARWHLSSACRPERQSLGWYQGETRQVPGRHLPKKRVVMSDLSFLRHPFTETE